MRAADARTVQALRELAETRSAMESDARELAELKAPQSVLHEKQFHSKWTAIGSAASRARKALGFFGKKCLHGFPNRFRSERQGVNSN